MSKRKRKDRNKDLGRTHSHENAIDSLQGQDQRSTTTDVVRCISWQQKKKTMYLRSSTIYDMYQDCDSLFSRKQLVAS